MIGDACPYCGAAKRYAACAGIEYRCGSWAAENGAKVQSTECARYIRLRISQLRRMAEACKSLFSRAIETSERRAPEFPPAERIIAINTRIRRFRAACLAEIERLRGMG